MRFWVFGLVLVCCLGLMVGRAEGAPRIAVVHESSADENAIGRLRAELTTLGLEVVDVKREPGSGGEPPDAAARELGAFAAVRVVPGTGGVEVWIADRGTGATILREFVVAPRSTFDDVVALQAVELLRAKLAELGLPPKSVVASAPPAPVAATTRARPPPQSDEHHLLLQAGPGIMTSPGGLGATAGAFASVRWRATRAFGLDAWTFLPISSAGIETELGSASVRPYVFGIDAAVWLLPRGESWQLVVAGGIGVAHLVIDGRAQPPLLSRTETSTVALPFARLSAERRLSARFGLGLDGIVGVSTPKPIIRFDGREVADWGRPVVAGVLVFDLALD